MSEPEIHKSASKGTTLERDRNDVLGAARPLPPDADLLICQRRSNFDPRSTVEN